MKLLRSAFLVLLLLLVLVQSAALRHFGDHLKPDADVGGDHACAFCLAVHGLDAPLPTLAKPVVGPLLPAEAPAQEAWFSCLPWLPLQCARAPPAA